MSLIISCVSNRLLCLYFFLTVLIWILTRLNHIIGLSFSFSWFSFHFCDIELNKVSCNSIIETISSSVNFFRQGTLHCFYLPSGIVSSNLIIIRPVLYYSDLSFNYVNSNLCFIGFILIIKDFNLVYRFLISELSLIC